MRTITGAALSACLFLSGCWTGFEKARTGHDGLPRGSSTEEVRSALGKPDRVVEEPGKARVWVYCYHTPFTMYVVPWTLFCTIILTYPSVLWLWGLGFSEYGSIEVTFGADGRVADKVLIMGCGCHP